MTKYLTITISQWHKFHWTGVVSKKKKNWQKDDLVIQNDDSMYQKYWLKSLNNYTFLQNNDPTSYSKDLLKSLFCQKNDLVT